jgi:TRAP-type mannitol/chloroaromatic compound transport system permease small subunit
MKSRSATRAVLEVDRALNSIFKWFSYIGGAALLLAAFSSCADIISSKLFGRAIANVPSLVEYLLILEVYCVVARIQMEKGLMSVDIISVHFSPRIKRLIELSGIVLGVCVYTLSAYKAVDLLATSIERGQRVEPSVTAFYSWPFILVFVVGTAFLSISLIWRFVGLLNFEDSMQQSPLGKDDDLRDTDDNRAFPLEDARR